MTLPGHRFFRRAWSLCVRHKTRYELRDEVLACVHKVMLHYLFELAVTDAWLNSCSAAGEIQFASLFSYIGTYPATARSETNQA